jgi:hypothetical protein
LAEITVTLPGYRYLVCFAVGIAQFIISQPGIENLKDFIIDRILSGKNGKIFDSGVNINLVNRNAGVQFIFIEDETIFFRF